ncbi:50S ribosomal protein L13 [Nanoarchaeota archaeon NZ13-N]|uniref:Large ribosomal subunit protein uL13 n=1 Tax=Candidatus Nanoclepta minutus TaxID=1940235 RepID=A0A397WQY5_9ARCH|nr:MAG: 50S ribosomal protein L13 [Nanoarchaeota archaeon NZ13-N]RIB35483.1 MAG: 50S ribosomal protein L13 [Candidatus Nanoclepta minutus]
MKVKDLPEEVYVNGEGHVLGRLASYVAKILLSGRKVYVVNAEKIVITGKWKNLVEEWRHKVLERGDWYKGPFYPKRPDRIFRRVVRGMLPKNKKGREALRNLKVYIGIPDDLSNKSFMIFEKALITERVKYSRRKIWYTELGEISKQLGAKF